ncbi:YybH family protein [Kibdelosporangium phytohabitans]|uniref:Hydrolase n=1 Tax=Kibdelosporangium phytohabitans TaxID=860235 RepID=A0A0N9IBR9_9PSEU|nr:nuclear transport factor 2 family protein [Kibdelosporangium phytohabitans]ALG13702.1 hydrolase [Kibdelosporangium phytohabitans]MBE1465591.1 ketosteroid isomerase-like protein [Kibdelosporangium phytohabitans]
MTSVHDATDMPHAFARAFNTFDPDEVERLYEPEGLLVLAAGEPLTGAARAAANAGLLALGKPMTVEPRAVYVSGDIALLIVDWTIADAGVSGTATDVARRGPDGCWRYVIDHPGVSGQPVGR